MLYLAKQSWKKDLSSGKSDGQPQVIWSTKWDENIPDKQFYFSAPAVSQVISLDIYLF